MNKQCSKCGECKSFPQEYFRDNRLKSGYRACCKTCDVKIKRSPEAIFRGKQSKKSPRNKKERAAKERIRQNTLYRSDDKFREGKLERDKKYRKTLKGRLTKLRAKSRRRANGGNHKLSDQEWETLLQAFNHSCAYCNKQVDKLTADHIKPISRGGDTIMGNILPACHSCNSSKQDSSFDEWCNKEQKQRILTALESLK